MYRSTDATYPLVLVQALGGATQAELDEASRAFARAFERGGPIVCISDIRRAHHDAVQRRLASAWATHIKQNYGSRVIATIVVLDSALLRGALTALNWLSPPIIPQPIVSDLREAIELAKQIYEQHSVAVALDVWVQVRSWLEQGVTSLGGRS